MLTRSRRVIGKKLLVSRGGIPSTGLQFYADLWNYGQQDFLLSFDGNDFGSYTVANFRSADSSGAAEGWVRSSSTANNQTIIASSDTATTTSRWMIYVAQTTGRLTISTQDAAGTVNTVSGTTDICDGKLVHWKVNSSGTAWDIDFNGVAETLIVVAGTNTGDWFADVTLRDNLTIGAMTHTSTVNYAIGEIGFTRIYSRTMATAEALTNYQRGRKATASDTTGLVFNLPLTEGTGNPADTIIPATITLTGATWVEGLIDRSTNALAMTSFGSPTWGNTGRTFDGTGNQYIQIDNALVALDNLWDGGGSFVIWFTPSAITTIHGLWGKGTNTYLWLRGSSGAGQIQLGQAFSGGNATWRTSASGLLVNDTPVMLTVLYNADAAANDPTIYLNLTQQSIGTDLNSSGTRTTDAGTNTLLAKEQGNFALNGILHEIWRWNPKTLTLAELTQVYNTTKWRHSL